jgi:hypothetical protein
LTLKPTHLLLDDPTSEDQFGAHTKVASLVTDEIVDSRSGRSIAVVGEWGSGKSTVIKLIEAQLEKLRPSEERKVDARVFAYDAWSHQGDPLRRSFLDDLITFLQKEKLITEVQARAYVERIWNRQELTTTTSQPIARKHALLLLLSLALVPLGYKILDFPTSKSFSVALEASRNILAMMLIVAPLPLIAIFGLINLVGPSWLRRFLFSVSDRDDQFSVLSFFFQKIQGTSERKLIKTPADSIIEFNAIFHDLLQLASHNRDTLKLVIIIDNIDRIPPEHARDFWSTMQTFFAEDGGLKKARARKYWLVVPFSLHALAFIFRDTAGGTDSAAEEKAKSYVDKTFGIALNVPPPIFANWRKYLLTQLETAFPENVQEERVAARDLYGLSIQAATAVTPRSLKLFVNALVVFYRQRGDEISLPLIAAFLVHEGTIRKSGISDGLLSSQELRILDVPNWRASLAALHFGVSVSEANQILLQGPIQQALNTSNTDDLKKLQGQPGFDDVLVIAARAELEVDSTAARLTQIAATIEDLRAANEGGLLVLWAQLRRQLKYSLDWKKFQSPVAVGLKAILDHTPTSERSTITQTIVGSLSNCEVAVIDANQNTPNRFAQYWLDAALATIASGTPPTSLLKLPGNAAFKLETLQQIAELPSVSVVATAIEPPAVGEIQNAAITEIQAGRPLRTCERFVALVTHTIKIALVWPAIVQAVATRLRANELTPPECSPLVRLIVSIATIGGDSSAWDNLKALSVEGVLSHRLHQQWQDQNARASIIGATLLANPTFERPQHTGESGAGDGDFNGAINANPFDSTLIQSIAEFVYVLGATRALYEVGARNANVSRICAAVIGAIGKVRTDLAIDPKFVVENQAFLDNHAEFISTEEFLLRLNGRAVVLDILTAETFRTDRCRLYRAALGVSDQIDSQNYLTFLEQGLHSLPETEWDKALNAASGPYYSLGFLCGDLRKRHLSFDLSVNVRDAILEQVRKVAKGAIPLTQTVRENLKRLFDLVQRGQQQSLINDVADDLVSAPNATFAKLVIDLFGEMIPSDIIAERESDQIVRRVLDPILGEPDEPSINWMSRLLQDYPGIVSDADTDLQSEFAVRLRSAFDSASKPSPLADAFQSIADAFVVDLAAPPAPVDSERGREEPPK